MVKPKTEQLKLVEVESNFKSDVAVEYPWEHKIPWPWYDTIFLPCGHQARVRVSDLENEEIEAFECFYC